jgi:hypothetical protein
MSKNVTVENKRLLDILERYPPLNFDRNLHVDILIKPQCLFEMRAHALTRGYKSLMKIFLNSLTPDGAKKNILVFMACLFKNKSIQEINTLLKYNLVYFTLLPTSKVRRNPFLP